MAEEKDGRRPELRGIRIKTFNLWIIGLACILYVVLLLETVYVSKKYDELQRTSDAYIAYMQDAALVREGSDYLTEQVRLYVITARREHIDNYIEEADVTRRRDRALEELSRYDISPSLGQSLRAALESSNHLMEQEYRAMRLTALAGGLPEADQPPAVREADLTAEELALSPGEQREKARELVFGTGYQEAKARIMGHISGFLDGVLGSAHDLRAATAREMDQLLYRQRLLISALFVLTVLTFIFISVLIIKPLTVYVRCIKEDRLFELVGTYEFKYLAVTYNDIYALNAANEAMLQKKAETDALTGLVNRGAFNQLTQARKKSREPMALLLVDVDRFKSVNDGYGHHVGDQVLQRVARLLAHSFRSGDVPARIGGDEFAVLLSGVVYDQRETIRKKIEKINAALLAPDDNLPPISISVGGAFSPAGYQDELYQQADSALYQVKEDGRNGCAFYAPPASFS